MLFIKKNSQNLARCRFFCEKAPYEKARMAAAAAVTAEAASKKKRMSLEQFDIYAKNQDNKYSDTQDIKTSVQGYGDYAFEVFALFCSFFMLSY